MIEVDFYDRMKIGMGSTFQVCNLRIRGEWIPRLQEDWQDRVAHSPDGWFRALVAWAINEKNEPGFPHCRARKRSRPECGCPVSNADRETA
jgi:hypothetical protein